jgi:16S rRNA (cytosine967-C5)-methyltransferase
VLRAVSERGAYANLVLPERLRAAGLHDRDAAFATELTYGTLRWQGTYDLLIDACVERPRPLDPVVRDLLRLGSHQLLSMNVSDHAAVATTVDLAKSGEARGASGLVNAVLRRISRTSKEQWLDQVAASMSPTSDEALGVRHAHPPWLVAAFRAALLARGRPVGELADLLAADNVAAAVTVAARPGQSTVDELFGHGDVQGRPGAWSPYAVTLTGGDPGSIPAVRDRRAGVQDEGSQLVAIALSRTGGVTARHSERWLDMCAGPGGKAALLSAVAEGEGATLEAWEQHPHRARLVQQQVGPGVKVRVVDSADASLVDEMAGSFDRILLDAPCSGAGALRRRPEARWRKSASDLPALVARQGRLLEAALRLVRPGGVVAYVVCSPLIEETSGVVEAAVAASEPDVTRLDAQAALPAEMPDLGVGPDVQLWPHLHGTDAMFLSLLRRDG